MKRSTILGSAMKLIANLTGDKKQDAISKLEHSMHNHTPGRLLKHSDGTVYRVAASGAWELVQGVRKGAKKRARA